MKVQLEGVIVEMRRVTKTHRAGYAGERPIVSTLGWIAKVMFYHGALKSDPIEIPVDESATVQSVVKIEMTIDTPKEPRIADLEGRADREDSWRREQNERGEG